MSAQVTQDRRASTDKTHTDIRELILKTDSPTDKATLLILLKISENLETNTAMTESVASKVADHLVRYEEHETKDAVRVGQIRTAWWMLSGIMVILQGVALYAIKSYSEDYKAVVRNVEEIRRDVDTLKERQRIGDEIRKAQK